MKKILFMICCFFITFSCVYAEDNELSPNAKSAIVIEASTGEVIYEYNADKSMPPA